MSKSINFLKAEEIAIGWEIQRNRGWKTLQRLQDRRIRKTKSPEWRVLNHGCDCALPSTCVCLSFPTDPARVGQEMYSLTWSLNWYLSTVHFQLMSRKHICWIKFKRRQLSSLSRPNTDVRCVTLTKQPRTVFWVSLRTVGGACQERHMKLCLYL